MRPRIGASNPHAARASGDRWLFGYADVVTLLLAVFASLYASGLATSAESVADVVVNDTIVEVASEAPPVESVIDPPAATRGLTLIFEGMTDDTLALPGFEMATSTRGLILSLPEAGSFPAGSADLSLSAMSVMTDLAERLRELPNLVRVEGHTDDVPIATAQFASNWDLSTARATRVVEFLIEEGIDPGRLAAAGYAEYRPRLPNDSAEARARNRRVDIVVLDPVTAGREEPGVAAP